MKNELAQKLYSQNMWRVNITKLIIFRDQLRTDLKEFWISWTHEQSLNFYGQIVS